MYNSILVPTDGTALSDKAIDAAIQYATIHQGCRIIGMTVAEPLPLTQIESLTKNQESDYQTQENKIAQERVDRIAKRAKAAGIPYDILVRQSSKPHEEIVSAAGEYNCDCIFMASNGRKGLNKLFIGSETQKVLATAAIPVLVYR